MVNTQLEKMVSSGRIGYGLVKIDKIQKDTEFQKIRGIEK
jgi:hypothetical protein